MRRTYGQVAAGAALQPAARSPLSTAARPPSPSPGKGGKSARRLRGTHAQARAGRRASGNSALRRPRPCTPHRRREAPGGAAAPAARGWARWGRGRHPPRGGPVLPHPPGSAGVRPLRWPLGGARRENDRRAGQKAAPKPARVLRRPEGSRTL